MFILRTKCSKGGRICNTPSREGAPSAIVIFLEVVIKDKIVKFSKNCGTFTIKKSGGGESIINGSLNSKIIIIISKIVQGSLENSLDLRWRNGQRR